MNTGMQKNCPFCSETIPSAARICPRCRRWLKWCSLRHPAFFVTLHLLFFTLLAVWVVTSFRHMFNPGPHYTEFRDSLQILESRMNWVEKDEETRIYITGVLTNKSPVAWQGIELECRFYDLNGVLIDAANARAFVTIQPNDDSAFRASIIPTFRTNDYNSFRLSVSTARNGKTPF